VARVYIPMQRVKWEITETFPTFGPITIRELERLWLKGRKYY